MGLKSHYSCPIWTPLFLHRRLLREHVAKFVPSIVSEATLLAGGMPRLLDAGCGYMPYRDLFESSGPLVYHGADIPWAGVKLDVVIDADTGQLKAPDACYDAVVHFQTLEHVPNPCVFLQECFRVLKPGGRMFCTVPFVYHFHPVPGDFRRWTIQGLRKELELVGFLVSEVSTVECDFVSWVTITNLFIADLIGYKLGKPLFLLLNILGLLLRGSRHRNLNLTVYAAALKE